MTQLDDGRQMREAMPYEIEYLKVRVAPIYPWLSFPEGGGGSCFLC